MPSQWHEVLDIKLSALFPGDQERRAARELLAAVLAGAEGERVAVACLKLSGGNLSRLQHFAKAATIDYRDVLAWAEYPRQMRLGPNAPPADQARASRDDMDEYARWLSGS